VPYFVILVKYVDSLKRRGTARLKVKAPDPGAARRKAVTELKEIEKFSRGHNKRSFDFSTIQVVRKAAPQRREGLLISRNNVKPGLEVWELRGTIDANTNRQFEDLMEEARMEGTGTIVLDCRGLDYINSTGIGTIVAAHSEMDMRLADIPQKILEIFMVVGLDSLLNIYYSVEEALEDF